MLYEEEQDMALPHKESASSLPYYDEVGRQSVLAHQQPNLGDSAGGQIPLSG